MSIFNNSKRKYNHSSKDIEPHEIFIDKLAEKKEEEFGLDKKKLEVSISPFTFKIFSLFILLLFFTLLIRSFQLQFVEGEYYDLRSQRNILSISKSQLHRGIIYDRNQNQLAYNLPQYSLFFNKNALPNIDKRIIYEISEIISKDYNEIIEKIESSSDNSVIVKRNLSHEELVKLRSRENKTIGFYIDGSAGRSYYEGEFFSHILGYIGKIDRDTLLRNPEKYTIHDYTGKMGIERYYEEYLSRAGEKKKITKDVRGNIIDEKILEEEQKTENVILTIDADLQKIAVNRTREKLEEIGAKKAAVIIINPQNGEILSLVSMPSYDNNVFHQETDQSIFQELFENKDAVMLNRVTSATYPTGSVIKPLLAVAALEEKLITPDKKIHSPGYISIHNPWNPSQPTIFRDFHVHGWRDMREAIAVSSNVYFYAIGGGYENQKGLGAAKIKEYLNLFGWGERTGVDLPSESKGVIPSPEWKNEKIKDNWRIGDTYNLSIGQGYLEATPIQVANSFAPIINGGFLYKPQLLKRIIDDEGSIIFENEPVVIRQGIAKEENLKVAKEGMKQATVIGTARSLQTLPVSSGAKTGTAQTSRPGINNNWVTAFAPYEEPELLITVIIEEVRGVTPVATHLARDILTDYFLTKE